MIFILLILFVLLIPFKLRVYAEKFDKFGFKINFTALWNLVRFSYTDKGIPVLRISWWTIPLEESKKKAVEKVPGEKPGERKPEKKLPFAFDYEEGLRLFRKHYRRGLRILRKIFQIFQLSGYFDSTYSFGNPAWDGISYGYLSPFIQIMTGKNFKTNLFPKFGSTDLYFIGKTDITVKTIIWSMVYFFGRSFRDLWALKKEIFNGKDRRHSKKDR
ncbi:MAG: hypothetical protein PHV06_11690 [bacterium]|nr:hypothetical protein [bacterium]